MRILVQSTKEVDAEFVEIRVPVSQSDRVPPDLPRLTNDIFSIVVYVDTGEIEDWPEYSVSLLLKVANKGQYTLMDKKAGTIAKINDYSPYKLIPSAYGEYLDLHITKNGLIANWPDKPDISQFFSSKIMGIDGKISYRRD